MHITLIAGARPNFMKIAALVHAIERYNEGLSVTGYGLPDSPKRVEYRLVHTGQHYDKNMSDTFFEELGIPAPDVNLGCGGGTQAEQTAAIMVAFEKDLMAYPTWSSIIWLRERKRWYHGGDDSDGCTVYHVARQHRAS